MSLHSFSAHHCSHTTVIRNSHFRLHHNRFAGYHLPPSLTEGDVLLRAVSSDALLGEHAVSSSIVISADGTGVM
jgi:hypothetical protein